MYRKMSSQTSIDYPDDPQSPLSEGRLGGNTHSTKTGPTCGTRCVVCSDVAPPNTVFRRHYGVICCEACKCFFRRTVQMGRDYKCRFGNNCPVGRTAVNMKQVCQACRFQTCTSAGMKIESVKKFPRKTKEPDYINTKATNGCPITTTTVSNTTRSTMKDGQTKISVKRESGRSTSSLRDQKIRKNQSNSTPSLMNKSVESKLSDGDFDYESEFEQFKFNIASPDLSLYHSVLDSAIPKLFSGESLENIHEKSSIPTPESSAGPAVVDNVDKPLSNDRTGGKGSPVGVAISITKQPSPLIITHSSNPPRSDATTAPTAVGGGGVGPMIPDVQSIVTDSKPDSSGVSVRVPTIQLVQSGEEKTGRELSNIMQENSKLAKKRGSSEAINWTDMLAKKIRLEEALNNINARQAQVRANLIRLSSYGGNAAISSAQTLGSVGGGGSYSHPTTPTLMQDINNGQLPYTPHETPHGTPAPSPLPSPCLSTPIPPPPPVLNQTHSYPNSPHPLSGQNLSQPGTPINTNSLPTSPAYSNQPTPTTLYGNPGHVYYPSASPKGTVFFNSQVPVPMYHSPHPFVPALVHVSQGYSHSPNPNSSQMSSPTIQHQQISFSSFRFPSSVPGMGPSPPKGSEGSQLPSPSVTYDSEGKLSMGVPEGSEQDYRDIVTPRGSISAPPSACPSPIPKPSRTLASDAPEAAVEEVLGSLKLRIRHMFKWARSEVEDFEDLSPLDQKALLRRTVSELVMLGFARASIPYDGMLLLGSTGKVIRNTNRNPGVAAVAMVTLSKLVIPLKVLNIDDKELRLMEEIILFNPESTGLYSRETVRQFRKRKHIELLEYTEKNVPGRFGELMCLLTPLYEVSLEVTEQLRLEQFVHEGEARIDALLLMSMINQGGGTTDEPIEDVAGN